MVGLLSFLRLPELHVDLKRCNKVFGNVEKKKNIFMEELCLFDIIEEERDLGVEERMKKAKVVSELERSTLVEEMSWETKISDLVVKGGRQVHEVCSQNS